MSEKRIVDPVDHRGMPASIETERLILAAILKDTLDFRDCRAVLNPEDWAVEAHRIIYRHMEVLSGAGSGIDYATLGESLKTARELEAVGGFSYIVDLDQHMPGLPRLDDYIRIVKNKSTLRKVVITADAIRNDAILERGDSSELLGRAERMIADLGMSQPRSSEFHTPGEVIRARGGLDSYLNRGRSFGVTTGFPRLDSETCGIRPGQLWILAASTSGGKSTFARNLGRHAAVNGHPGAFITLEMTEDEVTDGLICQEGDINSQVIRRGLAFERDKTRKASHDVADLPFYICDQGGATIPKLHGDLRRMKADQGIEWAVIDYLQLMTPVGRFGTRAEEIGHLSRGLKLIAQDLKIGIMALSQLTREPTKNKRRPELSDLRESGSIENDANVVIFLYSEWQATPMEVYPTELIIAKQRGGPIGSIQFGFRKSSGTFIEYSQEA